MRLGSGAAAAALVVFACTTVADPATTIFQPFPATDSPTSTSSSTTTSTTSSTTTTVAESRPEPGDLLVFGDWGTGTLPQGAVAGAMARYAEENRVTAVLTTGDNFYSNNAEFLLEPMDWVFQQNIPMWITWGNHDVESSRRIEVVEEAFGSPPRWTVHEWGQVDVVILDSNQVESVDQLEFLTETMEESEDPAIVVFHHSPLSCSLHGDTVTVLENWVPEFDEDVVLVLSGHDHNYQRFEESGVTYVVSGGGGNRLYELTPCPEDHPERVAGEAIHHFLILTQDRDRIMVEVVDVNGDTIDNFSIDLS